MKINMVEKFLQFEKKAQEFEKSPAFQKFQAEQQAEVLKKRKAEAAAIAKLEKEHELVIPALVAARDEKEQIYLAAKAVLDKAVEEFNTARSDLSGESARLTAAIARHEGELRKTAWPEIQSAIEFFQEKLDALRKPHIIWHIPLEAEKSIFSGKIKLQGQNNINAVNVALQYCQNAIKTLENMNFQPALDLEAIEQLKAGIPDHSEMETFTSERVYQRVS